VKGGKNLAKKSYAWFERRRRTKVLDLTQEQITKALDTVTLLHQITQNVADSKTEDAMQQFEQLYKVEKEVDTLRTDVFKELSKGTAMLTEYREDLMHLVKRLDTLADYVKDAARCVKILADSNIPNELWMQAVHTTGTLVECATALRASIEKIAVDPAAAMKNAEKVDQIENMIDQDYIKNKSMLIKHSGQANCGAITIFNDLFEFIEQAADMCADTADYIIILAENN
jgi:predicted phosphate transport protein (TIGR00153 family)